MSEFALVINNVFQEVRDYPTKPADIAHKLVKWLPVTRQSGAVASITVEANRVLIVYVIPAPPTADEIYAAKMQADPVLKAFAISLNKGTFVPNSNYTNTQMRNIVKAEM